MPPLSACGPKPRNCWSTSASNFVLGPLVCFALEEWRWCGLVGVLRMASCAKGGPKALSWAGWSTWGPTGT